MNGWISIIGLVVVLADLHIIEHWTIDLGEGLHFVIANHATSYSIVIPAKAFSLVPHPA